MSKYIVYSKTSGEEFWKINDRMLGCYDSLEIARENQRQIANEHLDNLKDIAFTLENSDDVYLIKQKITVLSKGYVYNSNIVMNIPKMSFHIGFLRNSSSKVDIKSPLVIKIEDSKNVNQIQAAVKEELSNFFKNKIVLKKTPKVEKAKSHSKTHEILNKRIAQLRQTNIIDDDEDFFAL